MWPFSRKENPVNSSILLVNGNGPVIYTPKDYESLSKAGYQSCSTVYSCVKLIANTASRLEWYLQRTSVGGKPQEIETHPLLDLLKSPNEVESGSLFTEKLLSHLLLAGNNYALCVSGLTGRPPRFLYSLRPDRMTINPDKSGKFLVESYSYNKNRGGPTFPADQVMHMMEFHPTHDYYGLSRIEVAALQIDTMNAAAEWNAKLLQNDMRTPGMLTAKSKWNVETLKKMFRETYQGSENAGTPLIFSGEDIEWTDMSISPKDADWLAGQQFTMRQICSIYGVDPCLLGDSEYATYSNKQEARKGLYLEVILPLMDMLRDEYQRWLVPRYGEGLVLDYDRDAIEELKEDRVAQAQYLSTAWWITPNEKRVAMGFDELGPDGDAMMVPIGVLPLDQAVAEPEPPPAPIIVDPAAKPTAKPDDEPVPPKKSANAPARKSYWTNPERKSLLWKNFDRRLAMQEKQFAPLVRKYLRQQADRVKARLEAGATHNLIDVEEEAKAYGERFFPFYERAFRLAGQSGFHATQGKLYDPTEDVKAEGDKFVVSEEQLAKLRAQIAKSAKYFNETTGEFVKFFVEDAAIENVTTEQLTQELWRALDQRAVWEARRIAATEMTRTDGWGSVEGYKQNDTIDMKGWNCQKLDTSREDHVEADGQEVMVDEDFTIGGYAMAWPGDDRAPAGEVCNCRCSTYPVVSGLGD